jgi:GAF domain
MKFRINIRIFIASCILGLTLITLISFQYLYRQIDERDKLILEITDNDQPSLSALIMLKDKFEESKKLSSYRKRSEFAQDSIFSAEFNLLFGHEIPNIIEEITILSKYWNEEDQKLFIATSSLIRDSLYNLYLSEISMPYNEREDQSIFLLSGIDQNLSYLIDKRQNELYTISRNLDEYKNKLKRNLRTIFIFFPFFVFLFIAYLILFLRRNLKPLEISLHDLSNGIIPENIEIPEHSEFSEIIKNINSLFEYFRNISMVSEKIAQKDFQTKFTPLSNEDLMGNNLLNLQKNLKEATEEEEKRKVEDEQRNWVITGTARINDILRMSSDKLEELGYNLIKELVEYTGSRVGGLFIINQDENNQNIIELVASFAYDRQKFLEKKIFPGEGLVGRSIQENETIYINEVPENYLTIKSGLGEREPVSILIVPLRLNDIAYGVIEIGSFQNIEKYKIKFVENISDNIATTISKLKSNIQTSHLLEQTRQQAEEMVAQEEEMRQSMEELRAIQDKSTKREEKLLDEIAKLKR